MSCTTIRLTPPMLRELRMQLLKRGSFSAELELVEQRYDNDDVVVRLAGPGTQEQGDPILGAYNLARSGAA
jgi:hypothetical protein